MAYFASRCGGYENPVDRSVSTLPNYWQHVLDDTVPKFYGIDGKNLYLHLEKLEVICANDEVALFRLFPLSLRDHAKNWFHSLSPQSVRTYGDIQILFTKEFNPIYETHMLFCEISNFYQREDESFPQCWWRFKYSLCNWSQHTYELSYVLGIFYKRLNFETRQIIDKRCNGEFLDKDGEEIWDYYDQFAKDCLSCNQIENFEVINSNALAEETIEPLVARAIVDPNDGPKVQQSPQEHSSILEMDFHDATLEKSVPILVESSFDLDNQISPTIDYVIPLIEHPPLQEIIML
ncbi:hypothetical protein RHMOL_Rhmol01G0169100 [Rhododendron molle]|uniref:Uncharacterized protein n=1 Tax=Rhododendron molle TaxID=49168 RepID=A0ACC0Q267_RHOML|nr:hypothetical protein RHMOL_Rhmol01G0169100 [Rhododendron molle]